MGDDGSPEKVRFRRYAQMLSHEHIPHRQPPVPQPRLAAPDQRRRAVQVPQLPQRPCAAVVRDAREARHLAAVLREKRRVSLDCSRTEMIHYLRFAAIHHSESTRRRVEVYRDDGRELSALYFVLRLAIATMFGRTAPSPITCKKADCRVFRGTRRLQSTSSSALQAGCTDAMVSLATTFINEAAVERDSTINTARAVKWIHAAEYRGAPGAYVLQARLYSTGTYERDKKAELANECKRRVMSTNPSLFPWLWKKLF
jgi:hypothetical protein